MKQRLFSASILFLSILLLAVNALALDEPSPWATEAVNFAVEQGIVSADNIRPKDPATCAELAAMLTKLFRAEKQSDLHGITDVGSQNWYYEPMAKAVSMGLIQGFGGKLNPTAKLTREQAMTVLSRAFGLPDGDPVSLRQFQDAAAVSGWSAPSIAGLVEGGYVAGSGGKLTPKDLITRQDLAILLYKLTGTVVTNSETVSEGNVLWAHTDKLPQNVTISGNLYLAIDIQEPVKLRGVVVKGRLVLHSGKVELDGSSHAEEIVLCGENLSLQTGGFASVRVSDGNATVSGGGNLTAQAPVSISGGAWPEVRISGTTVTVQSDATIEKAVLDRKNSRLTGDGIVRAAQVLQKNCVVETKDTRLDQQIDAGVENVVINVTAKANETKPTAPAVKTTVQFTNVDAIHCRGAENNVRLCTLSWFVDGKLVQKTADFALTEGATATFSGTLDYGGIVYPTAKIQVVLSYEDESVQLTQSVNKHPELMVAAIETINVEATTRRNTTLYQNMGLSRPIGTIPANTKCIYVNYSGTYAAKVRLIDGRTGWILWSDLNISAKNYVQKTDYTMEQKVNFVNNKQYESTTKYLVWISLLKQKVNVFYGEKGNWKLVQSFQCSTGKNTTPTIGGVFRYQYRMNNWDFGSYYVNKPMIFNGGHAFHTLTYVKTSGGLLDARLQSTVSAGCIRMPDADVDWLWNNMPFGTTVVVF